MCCSQCQSSLQYDNLKIILFKIKIQKWGGGSKKSCVTLYFQVDPLSQPRLPMKLSQPLYFDETFDPKSKSFLLLEKFNGGEIKVRGGGVIFIHEGQNPRNFSTNQHHLSCQKLTVSVHNEFPPLVKRNKKTANPSNASG